MDEESLRSRLSRISTVWTELADAGRSSEMVASPARMAFIQRYQGAVYRYLLGAVRDPDEADELFQDFALKFVRGAFRHADPNRGRFRDYLKTALCHLVTDHGKQRRRSPSPLPHPAVDMAEPERQPETSEQQFVESWRDELLARAWEALAAEQRRGGQPYYDVLKYRAERPKATSQELALEISTRFRPSQPYTAAAIRKTLERARQQFAELLIDDVAHSLGEPVREELESELIDLKLMPYCRSALRRRYVGH